MPGGLSNRSVRQQARSAYPNAFELGGGAQSSWGAKGVRLQNGNPLRKALQAGETCGKSISMVKSILALIFVTSAIGATPLEQAYRSMYNLEFAAAHQSLREF